MRLSHILCCSSALALASCSGTISGRFADTTRLPAVSTAKLEVAGYAGAVPSTPRVSQSFSGLDSDVQVAALEALAESETPITVANIVELLRHPLSRASRQQTPNFTVFSRRLAFTTDYELQDGEGNPVWAPADRIDSLRMTVTLDNSATYSSWSRMETEHRSISLAELRQSSSSSFSLEGAFDTLSPDLAELTVGPSWKTDLTEAINLERSIPAFYTQLRDGEAIIVQAGERDMDLNGTLTVDVDIEVLACETELWGASFAQDWDGSSNPLSFSRISIPKSNETISATVQASGVVRHVERNAGTYLESDDQVRPISVASSTANFTVASPDDLKVEAFLIYRPMPSYDTDQALVFVGNGYSQALASIDIILLDESQAYQLLDFIRSTESTDLANLGIKVERIDRIGVGSIYELDRQQNDSEVDSNPVERAFWSNAIIRRVELSCPTPTPTTNE